MSDVLRLIDANANRAREGLRVCEDYARFVLDDGGLSGAIKDLRHGLAGALGGLAAGAVLYRDTPGDVGTTIRGAGEATRRTVGEVVVAAGKRVGEALRAIEEFLKIDHPAKAEAVQALRYRFYDLERRLALTLAGGRERFEKVRLYVLITESACRGGDWLAAADGAIEGGADCLQLREKSMDGGELLKRARALASRCRAAGVLFVVNDRVDVAIAAGADGAHVGQGDLPAEAARRLLGPGKLLGVSTHSIKQARSAAAAGADYIGVGPVFRSATKPRDWDAIPGLDYARQASPLGVPAVAIAGITLENLSEVLATGVGAVAVTAAVVGAADVAAAAREFKRRLEAAAEGAPAGR